MYFRLKHVANEKEKKSKLTNSQTKGYGYFMLSFAWLVFNFWLLFQNRPYILKYFILVLILLKMFQKIFIVI